MEKPKTGREGFFSAVMKTISSVTLLTIKNHPEQFMEATINHLFDLDGPRSMEREPATEEQFVYNVHRELKEIFESFNQLEDIGLYIRRFPFSGTRITRTRYLRTQIEAYLQEVYVLKERLKRFLGRIEKWYKDDYDEPALKAIPFRYNTV